MSRYRRSEMDIDYSGPPPQSQRWDASRFSRESQYRTAPVIEERPPYQPAPTQAPRRAETYYDEEQDYHERDYRGPRGEFRERRYFEEDDYYDPRAGAGVMVPFRPERPSRPAAPPRPAMVRRQSSVDRIDFERRDTRRYYDDYRPPPPRPPPQQDYRRSRQGSRYQYDDVRVQDPDYYGDDGFREYREREWTRSRTRNDSPSPDRRAPTAASHRSSHHSEFIDAVPPEEEHIEEHFEEQIIEEKPAEKPYPRRGKTRMPKRLVHTKVLFDLGYPFYEEDEKTILIEKALGPDNIDEVFSKSKEYFERQTVTTTKFIEAPPMSPRASVASPLSIHIQPLSEAPRSVREWDNIVDRSPSPGSSISQATRKSARRSKSQASRRESIHESIHADIRIDDRRSEAPRSIAPSRTTRAPSRQEIVHEDIHIDDHIYDRKSVAPSRVSRGPSRRESVHESTHEDIHIDARRSPSPAATARSGRSRRSRSHATRRSRSSSGTTIIERRKTVIEEGPIEPLEQSNPIDIGPLSLVTSRAGKRTDAEIQAEIIQLERERRDVRRDTETVRYESRTRRDSDPLRMGILRSPSPRGEIIVADRSTGEDIRVRKDKRAARSRSRPPGPGLLKSMMYTVT